MTQENNERTQPIHRASLWKRILIGAGIALCLITFFLAGAESDPAWPKLWMIRPLIIVPLAGAAGGVVYHFMDNLRDQGGSKKILANILSLVVYVFGLWLGIVLGLDGTLWD